LDLLVNGFKIMIKDVILPNEHEMFIHSNTTSLVSISR
jgi:hypothetical protein